MRYGELKIVEALRASEYRNLVKGWDRQRYTDIFLNPRYRHDRRGYRVYLPLKSQPHSTQQTQPSQIQQQIQQFLEDNGYTLVDYIKGIVNNTKNQQDIKIGRVLTKLKRTDLLNAFNTDKTREATKSKYIAVISRHPYDIAGQSTDRGWTSCMNLKTGINRHYVPLDISAGTLVAYVTTTDDTDLKNPTGRVSIKPFVDVLGTPRIYFGIEDSVYGTNVPGFIDAVSAWVKQVNAAHELDEVAVLKFNDSLYKDSSLANQTVISKKGLSDEERASLSQIAKRPSTVLRVENPTEDQLSIAIINDTDGGYLFDRIIEKFPDAVRSVKIQRAAVSKLGKNLETILNQGITPVNDVINTAIERNPHIIMSLRNHATIKITKDMLQTVIKHDPRMLPDLRDHLGLLDRDLILMAIKKYPTNFDLFVKNNITADKTMVVTALAHNYPDMGRMIQYCLANKIPVDKEIVAASVNSESWFEKHVEDILSYNRDYPEAPIPLSTDQIIDTILNLYKHSNTGATHKFLKNLSLYGVRLDDNTLFEIIKTTKRVNILNYIDQEISEQLANKCLSINGAAIEFIADPTPQQQMLAVTTTPSAIDRIKNPTDQALAVALRKHPNSVIHLNNPTFEQFMLAVEHQMPKVNWADGHRDLLPDLVDLVTYMEDADLSDQQIIQVFDRAIQVEPNRIFDLMGRNMTEFLTDQMMINAAGKTHKSITVSARRQGRLPPTPVIIKELETELLNTGELIRHVKYYNEDADTPITFDRKTTLEILNAVKDKRQRSGLIVSSVLENLLTDDNDLSSLLKYALTNTPNPVYVLHELVKKDIKLNNSAITAAFGQINDYLTLDMDFSKLINTMIEKGYDLAGVADHFINTAESINDMATVMLSGVSKLITDPLKIKIIKQYPGLISLVPLVGDKSPPTDQMKEIAAQGGFWEPLKKDDMVRLGNPKATPKNKILRVLPTEYEIETVTGNVVKLPRARIHRANGLTPPSGYKYPTKDSE